MEKKYSFRSKITIMLLLVTVSISFVSFYLYNQYLTKKIYKSAEENVVNILHLIKDQYYYYAEHDEQSPIILLKKMEEHKWVLNTYLANAEGEILYPLESKYLDKDVLNPAKLSSLKQEITLESHKKESNPYTRIFLKMQNFFSCYECHNPNITTLGYTIFDISMVEAKKNKAFVLKFSLFFTFILVLIIGVVITLMHYQFVKKTLVHFQSKIEKINKGDLNERVIISESKELGQLGTDFNEMLNNFQETQNKFIICHKKELQNNKKLATVGEMAARLAHEIRNPITGIANAIEIIADEMQEEQNKPILEEIKRQANRVNDAVSNLLLYSRSKELKVHMGDFNVLVRSLILFLRSQNHDKKIIFHLNLYPNIPVFKFDHEQIENALLNLGLNAIQAINGSGEVTFTTNFNDLKKEVSISVKDTGIGIPENILPKIFNPFFTTRMEGTGLGLAIVKDIIEKHHGEIWVEQNIGAGSIFNITLPIEGNQFLN